ncbi:ABC transporter permease [Agromyces mediolanus]|uniref:Spermidine/putrescine transport system permease protein PotC n=1 Tax=Agromyces mediolanus TaxID=41986 RepID=A0A918CM33_AGRME|nr:ABC transporter permease [Agromyces mediolanus]GGR28440.1 ABC transporter permease [Agromyces mediolanus]GLJ72075.1 ABC transporter permease [Agromyces mediolanus]
MTAREMARSTGVPAAASAARPGPAVHRHRTPIRHRLLLAWSLVGFAFLFAPIVVIVAYSFNTGRLLVSFEDFGIESYLALFQKQVLSDAVSVSLRAAGLSSLIASGLGTLAGIALARRPGGWTVWFVGILLLVAVTPSIVGAVALLPWFVFLGQDLGFGVFNDGIARLTIGSSLFSVAVVAYLVRARLIGMQANLEEAAADLYSTPLRTLRRVTLPLAMPAILSGFLLSFTFSLDDTIVAAFVQVSGTTPWPVYVLSALRSGLRPEIAALSTGMLLLTLFALLVVAIILKRAGDSTADIAKTMAGGS